MTSKNRKRRTGSRSRALRAAELESRATSDPSALPSRVERRAARFRPGFYREIMADQDANRAYLNINGPRRGA
jgi:hypothetical protein